MHYLKIEYNYYCEFELDFYVYITDALIHFKTSLFTKYGFLFIFYTYS